MAVIAEPVGQVRLLVFRTNSLAWFGDRAIWSGFRKGALPARGLGLSTPVPAVPGSVNTVVDDADLGRSGRGCPPRTPGREAYHEIECPMTAQLLTLCGGILYFG
jgi:hypothetical protein